MHLQERLKQAKRPTQVVITPQLATQIKQLQNVSNKAITQVFSISYTQLKDIRRGLYD